MVNKKKLKNFLNARGITLKWLILLMLVLSLQMIFCSTCLAGVSYDYVDYSINLFADTYTNTTDSQLTQNYRTCFSNFDISAKNYIVTRVNQFLSDNGLSNLTDVNIVFYVKPLSSTQIGLCICVFNNGSPNGVSNLDHFLYVENQSIGNGFLPYSHNSNDYIYQFRMVYNIVNNGPYFDTTYNWNFNNSSLLPLSYYYSNLSSDNTFLTLTNIACAYIPTGFCYYPIGTTQSTIPVILRDVLGNYNYPTEPEQPSGDNGSGDNPSDNTGLGNITNSSGDNAGNINLLPIEQGITNLTNQISGDSQRIINQISGDNEKIINALTDSTTETTTEDFEDSFNDMLSTTENVVDPTTNFFSWLIDNIRSVLNSTGNYDINITLFDNTYTIHSDFFTLPDGDLKSFLQMSFIAWFGWRIIKKIRYIVYAVQCVKISSALDNTDFNADIL